MKSKLERHNPFRIKASKFWLYYFWERLFYLFFDVFIYNHLSTLGDTSRYLHASFKMPGLSSTDVMDTVGSLLGKFSLYIDVVANFPAMLLGFYCIYWTVEKLELRKKVNQQLLFLIISWPNFCIWTSVFGKELIGLVFSCIFAVLFVNFLNGHFKLRWRDYLATALCLLFKPQYFPFIFAGLFYIYVCKKFFGIKSSPFAQFGLFIIVIAVEIIALYAIRDIVDELSFQMHKHFVYPGMETSSRPNIFLQPGDFFKYTPYGMFIGFFGPTPGEMLRKPLQLIAGIESLAIIACFLWLCQRSIYRLVKYGRISPVPLCSIFLTVTGILFIHYPFGIFNPGSAIRYRTNFFFLFVVLFIYLYSYYNRNTIGEKQRVNLKRHRRRLKFKLY